MKIEAIIKARKECYRFLERVQSLEYAAGHHLEDCSIKDVSLSGPYSYPVLTGALRRASMDLTRALADMRRRG